jgi:hypothetical protein
MPFLSGFNGLTTGRAHKSRSSLLLGIFIIGTMCTVCTVPQPPVYAADGTPAALLSSGQAVDWWFGFKFNALSFPDCAQGAKRKCIFGGKPQAYKKFSQQFVYASRDVQLRPGSTCLGDTVNDPTGTTFDQIFHGSLFYVIWNDQFYKDPDLKQCRQKGFCEAPWGHSKGVLAWNDAGEGVVMQVSTPNWPGAGNAAPRQRNGNTLGCITSDGTKPQNNVLLSQGFFASRLNKSDVVKVVRALQNASVVTEHDRNAPDRVQVVNNGGPTEISDTVDQLGSVSDDAIFTDEMLSSGVRLVSKSANLNVPPWHMVSAILGGVGLKVATFYGGGSLGAAGKIPDTNGETPDCWDQRLGSPGAVKNIQRGNWDQTPFGMVAGSNHAKLAVGITSDHVISGDLNQEGRLSGTCSEGHNGRGGLFFVVEDQRLAKKLRETILSDTGDIGNIMQQQHLMQQLMQEEE